MKHPKAKIVARLRLKAKQATESANLRDKKAQEDYYEVLTRHAEAAPQVRELLTEAETLLSGNPAETSPADYERAKALIRRATTAFSFGPIPTLPITNGYREQAETLEAAAALLEDSEGDTVSTSELERFGILSYLRV